MRGFVAGGVLAALVLFLLAPAAAQSAPACVGAPPAFSTRCDEDAHLVVRAQANVTHEPRGEWNASGGAAACAEFPGHVEECPSETHLLNASAEWAVRADADGASAHETWTACVRVPLTMAAPASPPGPDGFWDPTGVRVCVRDGTVHFNDCVPIAAAVPWAEETLP